MTVGSHILPPSPARPLHRLGAGSAGEVWLAEDAAGRRVALKRIPDMPGIRATALKRELEALRLASERLGDIPGLVRVLHVGRTGGELWYTMELADLEGDPPMPRTLAREVETRGPLGGLLSMEITERLARALGALHDAGAVHRDVKPANILSVGNVWKLGDIGLLGIERTEMTAVGTPDFIPPWGPIDRRADLYALGRVLYCMVAGLPARSFPMLPAELLMPELQRETKLLNRLITKACDPDPDKRFQSASEFMEAIERTRVEIEGAGSWTRRRVLVAGSGGLLLAAAGAVSLPFIRARSRVQAQPISLFDGRTLNGWFMPSPEEHGPWLVEDDNLVAVRNQHYKSLHTNRKFRAGRLRAVVTPDHDRARLGITYGHPGGSHFVFYEDKYVWIRNGKEPVASEQPGRWRSFPGPILPSAGESIVMEADWNADRTLLKVNGELLQEVDGIAHHGNVGLHVWAGDGGRFSGIELEPRA